MINLGDQVKCKITGHEGIVTAITNWLYGCTRIAVQSDGKKDGVPVEAQWFDEAQLDIVELGKITPWQGEKKESIGPAGPRKDPASGRAGE